MLHEILLSLSGHPSPLLRAAGTPGADGIAPGSTADRVVSPPERALLASLAHISDLHVKLLSSTAQISSSHPSAICRAVATVIDSAHLAAFQKKVLEVEDSILRRDAGLVGAYNIVPLTAVVGEFEPWNRRMEWLWGVVQFVLEPGRRSEGASSTAVTTCAGSKLIDRLRLELQTGYADVEQTARSLVHAAELAWLKQASAWVLYGRLPSFGSGDFFVQRSDESEEEYICVPELLPSFVSPSTASSMLFIGRSLNRIRSKSLAHSEVGGAGHLSSQLAELTRLTYPLDPATLSRTIAHIRQFLSRTILQKLLPLSRVTDMLQLLREFLLLGRGEFAMALTQQADEKMRNRWQRADNLAHEGRSGLGTVVLKEGELSAVLAKTWAALGSMQGQHAEEDEGMEMARDLLRLALQKPKAATTPTATTAALEGGLASIAPTPFHNLLFSVPAAITVQVPSPLDLFVSQSDLQVYTAINSYLVSVRRAHLRLTDLWKITSLRRHHPAPPPTRGPNGGEHVRHLRRRHAARQNAMRSAWATSSAAIFFLSEIEAYLQTEVVAGLWDGFQRWIVTGSDEPRHEALPKPAPGTATPGRNARKQPGPPGDEDDGGGQDIWLAAADADPGPRRRSLDRHSDATNAPTTTTAPNASLHDPQSLATAHRVYLRILVRRLLLTHQPFTDPLYELLVHIDRLVALVRRLHGIWTSADLEADVGVVDAFVDNEKEERGVRAEIGRVEAEVRKGVEGVVSVLRGVEGSAGGGTLFAPDDDGSTGGEGDGESGVLGSGEQGQYVPRRVGGVDRLLMKLDFGSWFESGRRREDDEDVDDDWAG